MPQLANPIQLQKYLEGIDYPAPDGRLGCTFLLTNAPFLSPFML
jgi:hypothetical protein